jgi:hypothetical protein
MLLVRTRIGPSAIEGTGLFADEDIPAGTKTWEFLPGYDVMFARAQIDALPEIPRLELLRYVYHNERSGHFIYCLDNARFMNHSEQPNTRSVYPPDGSEGYDVATRLIKRGEELTCDYREFDAGIAEKLGSP